MLFKTKGIVLNFIKYKETSIIAKLYTEEFGLQSYIVNGVRNKNSKTKIALFQPLTLLDLVVYHKQSGGLQRISELKCLYPFYSIPVEIHKSAIALFISEILTKTLKEDYPNPLLFEFLLEKFMMFDKETNVKNFHLSFMIELSGFLGFMPTSTKDILHSGLIKIANTDEEDYLEKLIQQQNSSSIQASNFIRRNCLEYLIDFYSYHIENFGTVNSVKILKEVLSS